MDTGIAQLKCLGMIDNVIGNKTTTVQAGA